MQANIRIEQMPQMQLAGISSIGFQNVAESYKRLVQWAAAKDLL